MKRAANYLCQHPPCENEVDEPGLLCRLHWRCVPDVLRKQYEWIRKMALKAVRAHEEMR